MPASSSLAAWRSSRVRRRLRASVVPVSVITGAVATTWHIREREERHSGGLDSFTVHLNENGRYLDLDFDDDSHEYTTGVGRISRGIRWTDVTAADGAAEIVSQYNNEGRHERREGGKSAASVVFPCFRIALSFVLGFSLASYLMSAKPTTTAEEEEQAETIETTKTLAEAVSLSAPALALAPAFTTGTTMSTTTEATTTEKVETIEATKKFAEPVPALAPALAPAFAPAPSPNPVREEQDERRLEEVPSSSSPPSELVEMSSKLASLSRELRILKADPSELGVFTFRQLMTLNDKQEMYSNRVKDEMINRARALSPSSSKTLTPFSSSPTSSRASSSVTSPTSAADTTTMMNPSSSSSSPNTSTRT